MRVTQDCGFSLRPTLLRAVAALSVLVLTLAASPGAAGTLTTDDAEAGLCSAAAPSAEELSALGDPTDCLIDCEDALKLDRRACDQLPEPDRRACFDAAAAAYEVCLATCS